MLPRNWRDEYTHRSLARVKLLHMLFYRSSVVVRQRMTTFFTDNHVKGFVRLVLSCTSYKRCSLGQPYREAPLRPLLSRALPTQGMMHSASNDRWRKIHRLRYQSLNHAQIDNSVKCKVRAGRRSEWDRKRAGWFSRGEKRFSSKAGAIHTFFGSLNSLATLYQPTLTHTERLGVAVML
jgi:hypothetical protein